MRCTLDARPRVVPRDTALRAHAEAVLDAARSVGLAFDAGNASD
jgi:hypothetical protein